MKRHTSIFLLVLAGLVSSHQAISQTKLGYISSQDMIKAMPEYKMADTALAQYQDALNQQYAELVQDFNKKDSLLQSRDTFRYSKAKLELMHRDQQALYQRLQGWQQQTQQLYQQKQNELMGPIYNKVRAAINTVAKENGYAYVFVKEQLQAFPPGDDIEPLVRKKLGLK